MNNGETVRVDVDRSQPKGRPVPDGDASGMCPAMLPGRDDRPDKIAGPKSTERRRPGRVAEGESVLIRPTSVPLAMPARLDQQRPDTHYTEVFRGARPDAGAPTSASWTAAHRAVELSPAAEPVSTKAGRLEPTVEFPPGRVDRRGILQRSRLRQDPLEDVRLALQEHLDRPVALAAVARRTPGSRFETRSDPPLLRGTMARPGAGCRSCRNTRRWRGCSSCWYSRLVPASVP